MPSDNVAKKCRVFIEKKCTFITPSVCKIKGRNPTHTYTVTFVNEADKHGENTFKIHRTKYFLSPKKSTFQSLNCF